MDLPIPAEALVIWKSFLSTESFENLETTFFHFIK